MIQSDTLLQSVHAKSEHSLACISPSRLEASLRNRKSPHTSHVLQQNCAVAPHACVLIYGSLAVTHEGDILDYNLIIRELSFVNAIEHVKRHHC